MPLARPDLDVALAQLRVGQVNVHSVVARPADPGEGADLGAVQGHGLERLGRLFAHVRLQRGPDLPPSISTGLGLAVVVAEPGLEPSGPHPVSDARAVLDDGGEGLLGVVVGQLDAGVQSDRHGLGRGVLLQVDPTGEPLGPQGVEVLQGGEAVLILEVLALTRVLGPVHPREAPGDAERRHLGLHDLAQPLDQPLGTVAAPDVVDVLAAAARRAGQPPEVLELLALHVETIDRQLVRSLMHLADPPILRQLVLDDDDLGFGWHAVADAVQASRAVHVRHADRP